MLRRTFILTVGTGVLILIVLSCLVLPSASATFIEVQVKQYLRTNVAIFARNDCNLRKAEGGETAARNLRNAFFAGIDLMF